MADKNKNKICLPLLYAEGEFEKRGRETAEHIGCEFGRPQPGEISLLYDESGLKLTDGTLTLQADFSHLSKRINKNNLNSEMIVKCAKIKGRENPVLIDATAGFGEDSFLLAASGFNVTLCEYNPVISALLSDAITRAFEDEKTKAVAERLTLYEGDSIEYLSSLDFTPDVVLLDPMFPERQKSALVKKKFQLLQKLERPCSDEDELLEAALNAHPHKIVIKRPLKGPFLAGRKPDYSLQGKAIRYDCIVLANSPDER